MTIQERPQKKREMTFPAFWASSPTVLFYIGPWNFHSLSCLLEYFIAAELHFPFHPQTSSPLPNTCNIKWKSLEKPEN